MIKIAVLGLGNRGRVYGNQFNIHEGVKIVSVCDKFQEKIDNIREKWNVPVEACFTDEEKFFAQGKIADAMVICTQDRDHYGHAMKALELGYNIMLEKPVSPVLQECLDIEAKAKEKGVNVIVCHVLRYSNLFRKIHDLIASGILGDVKLIRHNEDVSYWHFSHSYVRGNWRRSDETTPLLMAKCCHDMDLLYWYAGARAKKINSYGDLSFFTEANAPEGATPLCKDCPHKDTCIYEARLQYLGRGDKPRKFPWGVYAFSTKETREDIAEKIQTGPYGRCVFKCDNNVCDCQTVNIEFENNIRAVFTVSAFNEDNYRFIYVNGTKGELFADDRKSVVTVRVFGEDEPREYVVGDKIDEAGHSGGDEGIADAVVRLIRGEYVPDATYIKDTIESHRMVLAAEESRLEGGKLIELL